MASGSGKKHNVPWYKEKFPKEKYERRGNPKWLTEEDTPKISGWVPVSSTEQEMWMDARATVLQKNTKKEFFIEFDEIPHSTPEGLRREIKILHTDYPGLIFFAVAPTLEELEKKFWPVVIKLISHFFSPKMVGNQGRSSFFDRLSA